MYSTVLIIPANIRDEANMLGESMGWGPNNYSVPLSKSGNLPATHYGLHAWAEQSFVDLMQGAAQGIIPPVEGLTQSQVIEVISSLITSIQADSNNHWKDVLTNNNLSMIA